MNRIVKIAIVLALILSLASCANVSKQDVGVVGGGLVGGALGSRFGSGSGRILTTVGGTVLGAFLGGAIGRNMDQVDKMKMNNALEHTRTDHVSSWKNPDTGNTYTVRPTRTYYRGDQPCRDFTTKAMIGGKRETIYGKACRKADGTWKVAQ